MSNSKEQLFSDDYVRGFLSQWHGAISGLNWEDYVNSHPPVPEPIVEIPRIKHPIELVNERYPNGWYCEAFEALVKDAKKADGCDEDWDYPCIGWNFTHYKGYNACLKGSQYIKDDATIITRSEYMAITRPQRDYTGVRFTFKNASGSWELKKQGEGYSIVGVTLPSIISVEKVVSNFADGTWTEIPNESKWQPKVGDLVEIYGDDESDGVFKGEYSHTTKDGYHYIKGNDTIGCVNIRPASNGVHVEQPKPVPTQRIESLEKSRKELFTNQSNIFSRLNIIEDRLERIEQGYELPTKKNLDIGEDKTISFGRELEKLINKYSLENNSNTPDYILSSYIVSCLNSFNEAVNQRTNWSNL
jgi:hypothetical protein